MSVIAKQQRKPAPATAQGATHDLAALAKQAHDGHEAGQRHAGGMLEQYRAAGVALIAARAECKRRGIGWVQWYRENIRFGKTQIYRYIEWANFPSTGNLEEDMREWRRISGNAPKVEADDEGEPGEDEWEDEQDSVDEPPPDTDTPDDETEPSPDDSSVSPHHTHPFVLKLTRAGHAKFTEKVAWLGKRHHIDNATATVVAAVDRWFAEGEVGND